MTSKVKQRTKIKELDELQDELDEPHKLDEPYAFIHHPLARPSYLG